MRPRVAALVLSAASPLACASLIGVETVGYVATEAGPDADAAAPGEGSTTSDGGVNDAGRDVAPVHVPSVSCDDVEGGTCAGALPVCCVVYAGNNTCVATVQDCPQSINTRAPVECDDLEDCAPQGRVCCTHHSNSTLYSSLCVIGPCDGELACDPTSEACPPDAGSCMHFESLYATCR